MSGARHSKRILRTTVAAAAAGAVVLAPMAPLAQEGAGPVDPVTIRIGANPTFTRVEFAGVIGARSQVRRAGQDVVIRIGTTAAPDVSRLRVDPPPGVTSVETRSVRGGTELVLTLAEGADAQTGSADGAVYVNLYAQAPEASEQAAPAIRQAVAVTSQAASDRVALSFRWPAPVGAAVFRRGEAVWVVFDTKARLDMSGATALGPASQAHWSAGADHVAVRLSAPENLPVSASNDGTTWTVTIGGPAASIGGVSVNRDDTGEPALVANMAGATRAIWLTDPLAGDRFAAVTALAPGKGFADRRQTLDMTLLPSAHGLVIETPVTDLAVKADGDLVTITRPGGLLLSPPSALLEAAPAEAGAPTKARFPALILANWADVGHAGFPARYRQMQDAAAAEAAAAAGNPRSSIEARLALARFLIGSGLGYEAVGVLNAIIAVAPNMSGEPEVRGLRGAARASIGRFDEASADFASGALAGDPSAAVWRGYIAAKQGDWAAARQAFSAGAGAVDDFPAEWRARFGAAHAEAALESGDPAAARALLTYVFSQNAPAADQLAARTVQAKLFEMDGMSDRALAVYTAVGRAPLDGVAVPGRLGAIRLALAKGTLKADAAARELEGLRFRWRGDKTELAVIRQLASLYKSQGLYREALTALAASDNLNRLPGASDLVADRDAIFRMLFLEGGADGLQPVQALALFYDFRELTPIGADGDEMVRRMSRRLVDVDLLSQAAELLKYQVDNRLEGVAKAQIATDLATIYLMNRQPEQALQALWSSRTTLLPTDMNAERRALEARALMNLTRYDHALEVLGSDTSADARAVRAEIFWKQENWAGAAPLYEGLLGDRYRNSAALSAAEEANVIRAGIAWSLARDAVGLGRMSRNYRPFIANARSRTVMSIALDDGTGGAATVGDFATLSASADTFAGWVGAMKTEFRQKTGGNRPAAPARPQAPAAAPAARPAA